MQPNRPEFSDNDTQTANQSPPVSPVSQPEVHDYLHPINDTPKRTFNSKRMMIVLSAVVGAAILAVIAMLLFALLPPNRNKTTTAPTTPTQSTQPTDTLTAKQAIDHVKVYFKATDTAKSPVTTPVMAPGKVFYTVIPDTTPLISVAGEVAPDASDSQLTSILKSLDYDKFTKRVFADGTNHTNYHADMTRSDVVCQVSATKPADVKANHWIEVKCLDIAQYTEYATAQQPLVSHYTPVTSTATQYGFVGKPVTSTSKTAGYTLAEIPVSTVIEQRLSALNNKAMFYQSPDGLWHYFRDHADGVIVECEQYATNDLKYAYLGQPCRNVTKGTMATVPAPNKQ